MSYARRISFSHLKVTHKTQIITMSKEKWLSHRFPRMKSYKSFKAESKRLLSSRMPRRNQRILNWKLNRHKLLKTMIKLMRVMPLWVMHLKRVRSVSSLWNSMWSNQDLKAIKLSSKFKLSSLLLQALNSVRKVHRLHRITTPHMRELSNEHLSRHILHQCRSQLKFPRAATAK